MNNKGIENRIEFYKIVKEYTKNVEFQEMKKCAHHGTSRYDHSVRVAYETYKVCKKLKMDYEEITIAALLHDFYTDEVNNLPQKERLQNHPEIACQNARRVFQISEEQEEMIRTHMFPITKEIPKSKAAWIIDGIDDVVAIKERKEEYYQYMKAGFLFLYRNTIKRLTKQNI